MSCTGPVFVVEVNRMSCVLPVFVVEVTWMRAMERENLAHLLATIHLVIRQQDGQEQGTGQYHHLTNFTYEKFVEK